MILMAKNQFSPYFVASWDDILSVALPSEAEMAATIKRAKGFYDDGPQWLVSLEFGFLNGVAAALVRKIIKGLEKLFVK